MDVQNSVMWKGATAAMEMFNALQTATASLVQYTNAYSIPFIIAANYFNQVEKKRFWSRTPYENMASYLKLSTINMELANSALKGNMRAIDHFLGMALQNGLHSPADGKFSDVTEFAHAMNRMSQQLAYTFPAAIEGIRSEFGFHFERQPAESRVDETERFIIYQVLPTDRRVQPRENAKPILIIPPFVLGGNILGFLPMEKRSYAHAFANQGIPTYMRVLKNIQTSEAVQLMGPEDEVKDTRRFCETIKARHGQPLTLNGYCQGGFAALCDILSGELDGLVDAFITCVSPMDGTRSKGFVDFLSELPREFNDLAYGSKTLPNGNKVIDGTLMGWIYKLKNIETETPLLSMWRDMMLVSKTQSDNPSDINKTAAALYYWLFYDRNDLPINITRMSFDSYNKPISKDGTLPIKLFGRTLNIKRIQEKKIPWLICYGKRDDLVEPASALAPLDFVDAEVTGFPKGHVAIATSWSHPDSAYALHKRFPEENTRGPVRFQLDLQDQIDQAAEAIQVQIDQASVLLPMEVPVEAETLPAIPQKAGIHEPKISQAPKKTRTRTRKKKEN